MDDIISSKAVLMSLEFPNSTFTTLCEDKIVYDALTPGGCGYLLSHHFVHQEIIG